MDDTILYVIIYMLIFYIISMKIVEFYLNKYIPINILLIKTILFGILCYGVNKII